MERRNLPQLRDLSNPQSGSLPGPPRAHASLAHHWHGAPPVEELVHGRCPLPGDNPVYCHGRHIIGGIAEGVTRIDAHVTQRQPVVGEVPRPHQRVPTGSPRQIDALGRVAQLADQISRDSQTLDLAGRLRPGDYLRDVGLVLPDDFAEEDRRFLGAPAGRITGGRLSQ